VPGQPVDHHPGERQSGLGAGDEECYELVDDFVDADVLAGSAVLVLAHYHLLILGERVYNVVAFVFLFLLRFLSC